MKRKFLVPLLAIAAIAATAAIPAAAQAEPHFYSNGKALAAESGEIGTGKQIISWGKLELITTSIGKLFCFNEFGGVAYNKEGGEGAAPGEAKVQAYNVYDCTNESCEVVFKSKIEIVPEGLNKFGFWEAKLFEEAGIIRLKVGNKTIGSPTQIKFLISCPPNGSGEIKTPTRGELTPKVKNGTALSAPSKIEFGAGSGELELAGIPEGKVAGSLKVMGYEANEIITSKNP
jgi:hypothetical protein